jgi:CxxC motif-containing protein
MKKHIVCISCPVGCRLTVYGEPDSEVIVTGNICHRGDAYGREEFSNPKRIVTATVKTSSKVVPYASVKTDKPLVKEEITGLLGALKGLRLSPPLRIGDVVILNYNLTGVNIVCTRWIPE